MDKIIAEGAVNPDTGKYSVFTPEVYSEILRSLRYCDAYLSDALYGIDKVEGLIDTGESGSVWFGFRKNGVDQLLVVNGKVEFDNFCGCDGDQNDVKFLGSYYRDIVRVDVAVVNRSKTLELTLEHADYRAFFNEKKKKGYEPEPAGSQKTF